VFKDDCMKVNYQERIEATVTELKIIIQRQRTITRPTKSSGTLFVKIWVTPRASSEVAELFVERVTVLARAIIIFNSVVVGSMISWYFTSYNYA